MSNTTKAAIAAIALAVAGVGAYWHYSPYLAIKQLRTAAEQKDAESFNAHVDYPKVRESLKGQLAAMMAVKLGSEGGASGGFEGLGAALGLALINPMIGVDPVRWTVSGLILKPSGALHQHAVGHARGR